MTTTKPLRSYFTYDEAQALLGKRVRTKRAWNGVPNGTTAKALKPYRPGFREGYSIGLEWDLPPQPFTPPLRDWFTKDEFERWIETL